MKTLFTSERIRFVEVSEDLIGDYLAMINDTERVARFIGHRTEAISEEKERAWVRKKLAEKESIFSMIEKETDAFIGNIELVDVRDRVAELGIAITAAQQNKGFGTEAVRAAVRYGMEQLGLRRIFLKVYPDNARAIHVYKTCGFREYERTEEDIFMELVRAEGATGMQFKKGDGWRACCDEESGRYTAEYGGVGAYHLYEITAEIFAGLADGMTESEASRLIGAGRHLYMDINDRCGPPYTVVFDDAYRELCPWADIVASGKEWPKELTDAAVELFPSERANRARRRKKKNGGKKEA